METIKTTTSLCPVCYTGIPAVVHRLGSQAIMNKSCPDHGPFESIVERDANFYQFIQDNNAPLIYEGLIIDVTYRCNLSCKWCYQHLTGEDVPKQRTYDLASEMPKGYNIILSGGEPTLREDLPEIITKLRDIGYSVCVLTNGLNIDWSLPCEWTLSHHNEAQTFFDTRTNENKQFCSIIYTDDDLDVFYQHVKDAIAMGVTVATTYRMHLAKPVGNDCSSSTHRYYVSDMVKKLAENGHKLEFISGYAPKTSFVPLLVDDVPFMLISWPTIENIDLLENNCAPWYHGKGTTPHNLITSIIKSESGN